ncbi:hypothetical protein D3C83_179540 [compost metagenome]
MLPPSRIISFQSRFRIDWRCSSVIGNCFRYSASLALKAARFAGVIKDMQNMFR